MNWSFKIKIKIKYMPNTDYYSHPELRKESVDG